jgi:hypothetical protein
LKRRTNRQQREEFIAEVRPLIAKMGLQEPDAQKGRKFL